jgi:phosphoribosyl-dephospho-CoA transferase
MMAGSPAPTHDLIRLREPMALMMDAPTPAWVRLALERNPWVVVRRGYTRHGTLPVGVRGLTRSERFAAHLAVGDIADWLTPEDLSGSNYLVAEWRRAEVPALTALDYVAPILAHGGHPVGSRRQCRFRSRDRRIDRDSVE